MYLPPAAERSDYPAARASLLCWERVRGRDDREGAGPFPFANLSLCRLRGSGDTLSQTGGDLRVTPPPPPPAGKDTNHINWLLGGGDGGACREGLRTKSAKQEELIDGWEASANRIKPSFDSADFESAHLSPVIITLDVAAVYRWYRAGRCDVADKIPDWLCSMMRHFSLFIPIIFSQTVFLFVCFFVNGGCSVNKTAASCQPIRKLISMSKVPAR